MKEKNLTIFCVAGVVFCLITLYIVLNYVNYIHVNVGQLDRYFVGSAVNISGSVKDVKTSNGHMFFDLEDGTGSVKIVLWEDTIKLLEMKNVNTRELKNGDYVNIIGNVQIYNGELEVIPLRENLIIRGGG
ncbi:MAG: exodeoxyribonuclease VII large subunit [Candidatus Aenigmarchaeota archaeon]|nr:exodeoxyribonuclease VII large subunit [Candidatus Aenigmarchaeota archaeon]